ncbi:hypothetical protein V8F20_005845 [Naviculisporaceae sp. PSN 640]
MSYQRVCLYLLMAHLMSCSFFGPLESRCSMAGLAAWKLKSKNLVQDPNTFFALVQHQSLILNLLARGRDGSVWALHGNILVAALAVTAHGDRDFSDPRQERLPSSRWLLSGSAQTKDGNRQQGLEASTSGPRQNWNQGGQAL